MNNIHRHCNFHNKFLQIPGIENISGNFHITKDTLVQFSRVCVAAHETRLFFVEQTSQTESNANDAMTNHR